MQIHNFRKILIILIHDSSDSNHSSKFTVLVVVEFTKIKRKKTAIKANTQPSSEF